jgi:hypothetical protein
MCSTMNTDSATVNCMCSTVNTDSATVNCMCRTVNTDSATVNCMCSTVKFKSPDILTLIKVGTVEWLGHVVRMDGGWTVKK